VTYAGAFGRIVSNFSPKYHNSIKIILEEGELQEVSLCKDFLHNAAYGKNIGSCIDRWSTNGHRRETGNRVGKKIF